jgi:hypothetical protein
VTAFKARKYLENLQQTNQGVKINCNSGALRTNLIRDFGTMKAWYIPDRIANIFSMHELEKKYRITYDSWKGHYVVHTPKGEVKFHKDCTSLSLCKAKICDTNMGSCPTINNWKMILHLASLGYPVTDATTATLVDNDNDACVKWCHNLTTKGNLHIKHPKIATC